MFISKKIIFSLLLFGSVNVSAQQLVFSTKAPKGGEALNFTYDPAGGTLANEKEIQCKVQSFVNLKRELGNVTLKKVGTVYKGTFLSKDSTDLVCLVFSAKAPTELSPQGYYIQFYDKGSVKANAYLAEAQLLTTMSSGVGVKADPAKAIRSYEKAFSAKPGLKKAYTGDYLTTLYRLDKERGKVLINNQIKSYQLEKNPTEVDMMTLMSLHLLLKDKAAAETLKPAIIIRYPKGNLAFNAAREPIYKEKDPDQIAQKMETLVKQFGLDPNNKADAMRISNLYYPLVHMYALKRNMEKFDLYSAKIINKTALASLANSVAWGLAEKNEEIDFAEALSKRSLTLLEEAKNEEIPSYYGSKEEYLADIERAYKTNADTYALILHHKGNDKEAVVYQERAGSAADADGNARYVMYLELAGDSEKAFKVADTYLKEGKGTAAMRTSFQKLYEKKNLTTPFATYMVDVDKAAFANKRAAWMKEMIDLPAPAFSLKNLKGESVSLASLRGKVVILDYWATWCGPCVASFPGMQKAQEKYANDKDVVFLFVNSWQREENRETLVKDFLTQKKYDFNVLFDTKNKQDPEIFDVITAYNVTGIPTKFIIGPDGNIKFKTSGFSGSADGVVEELDQMISLAKSK
ncbi:TlpA family protein disulfide reductase [Pedobacter gandavensis]|uniref:Redoxin domain-containing protein n=1 Tax=Pedobacter gandavensis TaxID=2679963 RepID=A0ABR6EVV5_9SPHI|nr:TlpA disulfide reductase family protein [Pedobacter gandavensis]MBB2149402.1 redoxin domain-containing protein [Pedobacter gandavensis]